MSLLERLEKQKVIIDKNNIEIKEQHMDDTSDGEYDAFKNMIHKEIIEQINQEASGIPNFESTRKDYILKAIQQMVDIKGNDVPRSDRGKLIKEIFDDIVGLGPLEPLLEDPEISEIMVNGPYRIYVERKGRISLSGMRFRDDNHVMHVINRIVSSVGRHIDEATPMVDARLSDGSRFNAIIPPSAIKGPTITIRKFSKKPLAALDLINYKSASSKMMSFLEACVKGKLNIIVAGGTGSGKTTLLNVLSGYIPTNERIVTIEDAAELQLNQEHVVTLESRPPNLEGAGEITIRDLVRNSLRMRPDRIIVGEVRSKETLDMLQAMNTGHDGSLTTAHANSSRELIARLETMVLMGGMELPVKAIREQIASAIDLIVHQARLKDGTRKIVNISEVVGMEGDTVVLQDLFYFKPEGLDVTGKLTGKFIATGIRPAFLEKLTDNGAIIRDDWFKN